MPWFRVVDLNGVEWTTADAHDRQVSVVIFLSRHSPYVKHIESHLGETTSQLIQRGVMVLGISPNDVTAYPSDGSEMLRKQVIEAGFVFPYGLDSSQRAAKAFRAMCTPEFFVYDRELRLVYHGQYDGSRPDNDVPTTGSDLLQAADAAMQLQVVSASQPASLGCSIKWRAGNEPGYLLAA